VRLVLDTSAVIHLVERKHKAVVAELRAAAEPPTISAVTLGELAVGWASLPADSPRRRTYRAARRLRIVNIVADGLQQEPVDLVLAFGVCRAAGIKGNDAWIAATAQFTDATLVTFDSTLATRYATIGNSTLLTL
jgi:predicted nucleic acid-binding protein